MCTCKRLTEVPGEMKGQNDDLLENIKSEEDGDEEKANRWIHDIEVSRARFDAPSLMVMQVS